MPSAPASANDCTWRSDRSIIRWTSMKPPASCTWSRMPSTISGPIVIGGTKWPSITSTWMTRAPASITVATYSPSRPKSDERMDGATRRPLGYSVAMEARPYRRAPKSFVAAMVFGGAALALLVFGLVLDALPEHGVGEWNGLPLGEYGTGDLLPTIIPLSFGALVFSAVALRRGPALGR